MSNIKDNLLQLIGKTPLVRFLIYIKMNTERKS